MEINESFVDGILLLLDFAINLSRISKSIVRFTQLAASNFPSVSVFCVRCVFVLNYQIEICSRHDSQYRGVDLLMPACRQYRNRFGCELYEYIY